MLIYNWIVNGISIRENTGSTATHASIASGNLSMNGILMWDNGKASGRPNTIDGQAADFGTTIERRCQGASQRNARKRKERGCCKPPAAPPAG